ncbi:PQQ-like beta-propeller repeat protein [Phragmitibacter flavus]|uniref:PQQ-like beta-propeller repeat protein n=1 Tax=Phragmitibacter flavus TaxID=2576071 RepID=A0A5R8KKM4_9BACT|nr:PQQ-binding-like beta-propeller repeat protein [Phragmitibacter flavus]TLD72771.1 PQQ-like beta-propeller repeat protein [Phragmitibacter flavus]
MPMRHLAPLLLLYLVLLLPCLTVSGQSADPDSEWPRFRGPAGDGTWNSPSLPDDLTLITPKKLWSTPLGAGYGGITISDECVYVMDRVKNPTEVERIHCFDVPTGRLLWQHTYPVTYDNLEYGSGPRASVTIHDGKAYTLGALGHTHCLDATTGKIVWSIDTRKTFNAEPPRWGFAASPFIWKDTVILHIAAQPGGTLLALDSATGTERWRSGNDPAGYSTPLVIQLEGHSEPQLIQWSPQHVLSLHPDTGKENWRFPYDIQYGVSIAQPLFQDGLLLVSGYWHGTRTLRLGTDPTTTPVLEWSQEKTHRGLMSQPLYKDGIVYLLDRSEGLLAFELATGEILWKDDHHFTPKDRNPQISLVWASQPRNIAAGLNANGELFFAKLNSDEYVEFSRHQIIGKTWAHPAFTSNRIYARSDTEISAWQLWD